MGPCCAMLSANSACCCNRFTPRTQTSHTELRIPDDLKTRHKYCLETRREYDFTNGSFAELIERIARLEGGS